MDYSNYVDPYFLDRISYIDKNGNRRVKSPYRNRKSYGIIVPKVNSDGNFVFTVPEPVIGKSVFVDFPGQVIYQFTVSAQTNEVTVIGIPVSTYIEINVVNPNPLPPSDDDILWDSLGYDAQKAIVSAWGEIDLICNVLYPATVEAELDFDDQNTIKYELVGWKNNHRNLKSVDWGRPSPPPNSIYHPPQPEPSEPSTDPDIDHEYDLKFVLRWEDNAYADLDFYAYLDHDINKRVMFARRHYETDEGQMWLDYDYTMHGPNGREEEPEIITVLGFNNSTISIQIHNYNKVNVREKVTVEVLNMRQELLQTFDIPFYHLSGDKCFWVCDVDLYTKTIQPVMREIPAMGTFN